MYFIKHFCSRMHPLSLSIMWRRVGLGFPLWAKEFLCAPDPLGSVLGLDSMNWHCTHRWLCGQAGEPITDHLKAQNNPFVKLAVFLRLVRFFLLNYRQTFPAQSSVSLGRMFPGAGSPTLVWLLCLSDLSLSELRSARPVQGSFGKSGNECWCLI